jgi:SSS family solute:Na+ symporter
LSVTSLDLVLFGAFYGAILAFSLYRSRGRKTSVDYFLGGRQLPWWLIGISIVAANISTEQFVGMAGQAAGDVGLAVSAWQLTGSVGIVVVAFFFLPRFLSAGISTMPEYLEYRYSPAARVVMSLLTVVIYVSVTTPAVLFSGATALETIFGVPLVSGVWLIAGIAVAYTAWGGLLAAAWADLFQGTALLAGGLLTFGLGLAAAGGPSAFLERNAGRLHMLLPASHGELPWTVLLGGIWIPIFYYCGLNQFIVQRALAARSLRQAQLGVIFAGALWLLVPFAIVMPGMMAEQLYGERLARPDQAWPTLVRELIPSGLRGFLFAAVAGAVISSLASVLNSAATIFTLDFYERYLERGASEGRMVSVGRLATVGFLGIACVVALSPILKGGVFRFIQEFQGYVSPGILAAFAFGFAVRRAPPSAGLAALLLSPLVYGALQWRFASVPYLHRMLATFAVLVLAMGALTWLRPLDTPRELPVRGTPEAGAPAAVLWAGALVLLGVLAFFTLFR